MDAILQDALPHDVMMLCPHALANASPLCCEKHEDEFKEFLRALSERIAVEREQDAAEADEAGDTPQQVH